jgi:NADH-quinone oxidoreductase subunit K
MPIGHFLVLSGLLFAIGTAGVFLRKNLITLLLSIEIMLNAVNLAFVAFGGSWAPTTARSSRSS